MVGMFHVASPDTSPLKTQRISPNKVRQAPFGTNAALIAGYKSRRPVQTLTVVMGAQKRIRTELKKMAPVLEPKFTNNGLKAV
jgi:hypothetical protein